MTVAYASMQEARAFLNRLLQFSSPNVSSGPFRPTVSASGFAEQTVSKTSPPAPFAATCVIEQGESRVPDYASATSSLPSLVTILEAPMRTIKRGCFVLEGHRCGEKYLEHRLL